MAHKAFLHHKISNKDIDSRTGECSLCGPVKINPKEAGKWECENRRRFNYFRAEYGEVIAIIIMSQLPNTPKVCAVCKADNDTAKIVLDHNHDTHIVRDWLCQRCNMVLGQVKEDTSVLEGLIAYINLHEGSK